MTLTAKKTKRGYTVRLQRQETTYQGEGATFVLAMIEALKLIQPLRREDLHK